MLGALRNLGFVATLFVLVVAVTGCLGASSEVPAPEDLGVTEVAPTAEVAAPPPTAAAPAVASAGFAAGVKPILDASCVMCHGADNPKAGLSLVGYASLMAGSANGPVVVPGDAAASRLVQLVTDGRMPKNAEKLTPEQIQMLTDWVNGGAADD